MNDEFPQWIDFEMEQQPQFDLSPLVGALKQRQQQKPAGGVGGAMTGEMVEMPKMDTMKGGGKSL